MKKYKVLTFQLGSFLNGTILLLSISLKSSLACYGDNSKSHWKGPSDPKRVRDMMISSDETPETQNVSRIKNDFDRNVKVSWGGWTPAPEVLTEWKKWVTNYELLNNDTDFMKDGEKEKLDRERKGTGWPSDWLG